MPILSHYYTLSSIFQAKHSNWELLRAWKLLLAMGKLVQRRRIPLSSKHLTKSLFGKLGSLNVIGHCRNLYYWSNGSLQLFPLIRKTRSSPIIGLDLGGGHSRRKNCRVTQKSLWGSQGATLRKFP